MGNLLGAPVTDKDTHVGTTPDGVQFGVSSMQGWRVHMEDAHIAECHLYAAEPENNDDSSQENPTEEAQAEGMKRNKIDLPGHSLFAVFDGHGGTYAAAYAGRNMCRVLSCQPRFVKYAKFVKEKAEKEKVPATPVERANYMKAGLELLESALCDAFVELDKEIALALKGSKVPEADQPYHDEAEASDSDANNNADAENTNPEAMEGVTQQSKENQGTPADTTPIQVMEEEGDSGTTACVVLLTPDWTVCANAGDSRAVISRMGNRAVPLSYDHKPDDDEEERRIRTAGGYVAGGRVEGDLAVSRGLGDFRFKSLDVVMAASSALPHNGGPQAQSAQNNDADEANSGGRRPSQPVLAPGDQKVSPVPDIIVQSRNTAQDEFVVIACDGIWDVQTNYEAVKTIAELFKEGESNLGLLSEEVCDICLSMGSKDNMTVLILKFDGQAVGDGGGVLARRQLRDSANADQTAQTAKSSFATSRV